MSTTKRKIERMSRADGEAWLAAHGFSCEGTQEHSPWRAGREFEVKPTLLGAWTARGPEGGSQAESPEVALRMVGWNWAVAERIAK